jgi:CRP/FNR family cyclic AMP-dependent transcriptional regulator
MTGRFSGVDGQRRLVDALQGQQLVRDDGQLAERLAAISTIESFPKAMNLTVQGSDDNDLYLLLTGRVAVVIKGQEMAQRSAGTHVGEMSLIDPAARRSASCIALEETLAARIAEPAFSELARHFPVLWRNIALVLGERLRQRTAFVRMKNETPVNGTELGRESFRMSIFPDVSACSAASGL